MILSNNLYKCLNKKRRDLSVTKVQKYLKKITKNYIYRMRCYVFQILCLLFFIYNKFLDKVSTLLR